jgi:hypothetical protein
MDRCCGLEVHKDSIFVCILDGESKKNLEQRYGTLISELTELWDTLVSYPIPSLLTRKFTNPELASHNKHNHYLPYVNHDIQHTHLSKQNQYI